jgi:hypothetical protein
MKSIIRIIAVFFIAFYAPIITSGQWVSDPESNTLIKDSDGMLTVPHVASTPSGNSYLSWYSASDGLQFDMYLQYLDMSGNLMWGENGLLVGANETFTWVSDYGLAVDQEGYAILTYMDLRNGFSDAYAYRISPEGGFSWGQDGLQLTNDPDNNWWQQVLVTEENDYIFLYTIEPLDTLEPVKFGLQKRDEAGNLLWGENVFTGFETDFFMPQMILTEQGNLVLSWLQKTSLPDSVMGQQNWIRVYLQKFSSDGIPVWTEPVRVDSGDIVAYNAAYVVPYLAKDGSDGAYVAWQSFFQEDPTIRVNHIGSDGQVLWQPNGIQAEISLQMESLQPSIVYDPVGDNLHMAYLVYKYDNINQVDCWAVGEQKFSPAGERLWGDLPKLLAPFLCSTDSAYTLAIINQAPEEKTCVFYEKVYLLDTGTDTIQQADVHACLLDADGNYIWPEETVIVSSADGYKGYLTVGNYSSGQWVTAWSDNRQHPHQFYFNDIYAQNLTLDGLLGPLSVDEDPFGKIRSYNCYPNPFQDKITLTLTFGKFEMQVIDAMGRTVLTYSESLEDHQPNSYQFDTRPLIPGIYFIKIQTMNGVFVSKVMKI